MKYHLLVAASVLAPASPGTPAAAQHMHMPGMPMPVLEKPTPKKKQGVRQSAAKKRPASKTKSLSGGGIAPTATAGTSPEGMSMPMENGATKSSAEPTRVDHSQTGVMPGMQHGEVPMSGALGTYPMTRESSGTAWQPDASEHMGLMAMTGGWTLMGHGILNLVYDHQSEARGQNKAFASGMLMGMARRPLGNGTLQLSADAQPRSADGQPAAIRCCSPAGRPRTATTG